jgi:hypothetical protein
VTEPDGPIPRPTRADPTTASPTTTSPTTTSQMAVSPATASPTTAGRPVERVSQPAAWQEYLAAARRLDAVRRGAVAAAGEQAESVQTAREELTGVRARLVPQQSRLRGLGVSEMELLPSPPEVAMAVRAMAGGPAAALAALRQARGTADAADARVVQAAGGRPLARAAGWPPWQRNLLVYVPFALAALVGQLALSALAGAGSPLVLLLFAALLPAAAFGVGWLTVGLVFWPGPGRRVDRTALLGGLVCLVPALLGCALAAVLAIVGAKGG